MCTVCNVHARCLWKLERWHQSAWISSYGQLQATVWALCTNKCFLASLSSSDVKIHSVCFELLSVMSISLNLRLSSWLGCRKDCHVQVFVYVGTWTPRHSSFPSLIVLIYCYILRMYLHIFTWVSQFDDMSNIEKLVPLNNQFCD